MNKTLFLICDVWDNHYCADLRRRTEPLVEKINSFAKVIRQYGGRVLHCPSETVDTYYKNWSQRQSMRDYPRAEVTVSQEMRSVSSWLRTELTTGCPDTPQCRPHCEYTKQHDGIEILPEDLISDSGQEVYNFLAHEHIGRVLIGGTALNMCILGRPFGVISLAEEGISVRVVSDLVEVFYASVDWPHITLDQAKWYTLGNIAGKWCPITDCSSEALILQRTSKIDSNIPRSIVMNLQRKWKIKSFVETGTLYGDTTELAAVVFDEVWSCDIDPQMITNAQKRLSIYPNVRLSVRKSVEFLHYLKSKVVQPVMYWLDAHWCGGPKLARECPLLEELKEIGSLNGSSVILIDDVDLMESPPPPPHDPKQWPTLQQIESLISGWNENLHISIHSFPCSKLRDRKVMVITP